MAGRALLAVLAAVCSQPSPAAGQQRCVRLVCERLAMSPEAPATPSAAITLKVLCHTSKVGSIIGKGGSGLRELRSLGVAVDMPLVQQVQ